MKKVNHRKMEIETALPERTYNLVTKPFPGCLFTFRNRQTDTDLHFYPRVTFFKENA